MIEKCHSCGSGLAVGYRHSFCASCLLTDALPTGEPRATDGTSVAGYELLVILGTGAMGTVWLATDRKLGRLVALKIVQAESMAARRLVREAKVAASLRHRHIITVHDSGTLAGIAYLAMDFVEGGNLAEALRRSPGGRFDPKRAALLVSTVAGALDYAHGQGVRHRDIKPSNILLNEAGEPLLADFGLAAPNEGGGDLTRHDEVAGTLAYMAPELLQGAAHANERSDTYGLGAVLYTCLTGVAPYPGDSSPEIIHQLATTNPIAPRQTVSSIPLDLENICLKAMARTPAGRYASAQGLREDLLRFLRGEPVEARPVSRIRRLALWCNRNRAAALAIALLFFVAVGGTVTAFWATAKQRVTDAARQQADRERVQADVARAQAEVARRQAASDAAASKAMSDFLRDDLLAQSAPDTQPDPNLKLSVVVERAAKRVDGRFPDQPLVEAGIRKTLGETFESLTDYAKAREQFEKAHTLYQAHLPANDPIDLRVRASLTGVYVQAADFAAAERFGNETLGIVRRVLGPEDPLTLTTFSRMAGLNQKRGRLKEADAMFRELLATQQRVLGPEHLDTVRTMINVAVVSYSLSKYPEAEEMYLKSLAILRRTVGDKSPTTLKAIVNLVGVYSDWGKLGAGEKLLLEFMPVAESVLPPNHELTLAGMYHMASIYNRQGRHPESEVVYRKAYEGMSKTFDPYHPFLLATMQGLAAAYNNLGKLDEAQTMLEYVLKRKTTKLGPEHASTLVAMHNLAANLRRLGRLKEAEAVYLRTVEIKSRVLGRDARETINSAEGLVSVYMAMDRLDEAATLGADLSGRSTRAFGADHALTRRVQRVLGEVLLVQGRTEAAEKILREVTERSENLPDSAFEFNYTCADTWAEALLRLRRYADAEVVMRRCLDGRLKNTPGHWCVPYTRCLLAAALVGLERVDEAEIQLIDGYVSFVKNRAIVPVLERQLIRVAGNRLVDFMARNRPEKAGKWKALVESDPKDIPVDMMPQ